MDGSGALDATAASELTTAEAAQPARSAGSSAVSSPSALSSPPPSPSPSPHPSPSPSPDGSLPTAIVAPAPPDPTLVAPTTDPPAPRTPFDDGVLFDVDASQRVVKVPGALSPSRAGDFMQCPLMFRFRVIDKIPEPPSIEATRGTLVHAVLDRLFDLPAGSRTPDEAVTLLGPEWDKLVQENPQVQELFSTDDERSKWLSSAKDLLGRYFTLEDPNRLEPARREWFVRATVGEGEEQLVLRGIVDRLDVSPQGLVRVVDYKTGKAPKPGFEGKYLFQMKFYAVVLWRLRGVVPKRLQLLFLGSGDVLTYDPDERDLVTTELKILAVWDAIRTAIHSGQWTAKPTKLCGWCSFKAMCPAHGGETPPMPAVEIVAA